MTNQIIDIPLSDIDPDPDQPRKQFDQDAIDRLAETITLHGQQEPIRVFAAEDRFRILSGERRWRALKQLGYASVQAIVVERGCDPAALLERRFIADCQREDLSPIEKAEAIRRLMENRGIPASEAAARLGLSQPTVCKLLKLLELPPGVRERVARGEIGLSAAYELTQAEPASQATLVEEAMAGKLSREALRRKIRRVQRSAEAGSEVSPRRVTAPLGDGRSVTVSGRGLDLETMIDWLDQLLSKAKKARSQGLAVETFVRALKDQAKGAPS